MQRNDYGSSQRARGHGDAPQKAPHAPQKAPQQKGTTAILCEKWWLSPFFANKGDSRHFGN